MRIVQVTPYYPPHIGGVERFVHDFTDRLAQRGHRVLVITSNSTMGRSNRQELITLSYQLRFYNAPISLALPSVLKRIKADVVHSYIGPMYYADVVGILKFLRQINIPTVLTFQGIIGKERILDRIILISYYKVFGKLISKGFDIVTAVTRNDRRFLETIGVNTRKIKIVPNAVDTNVFRPNLTKLPRLVYSGHSYKRTILFVGRFNQQKGIPYFLDAIKCLAKTRTDFIVALVGGGELEAHMRQYVKKERLSPFVRFNGIVPSTLMPRVYCSADLFVLPSSYEGLSISLLEAMSCGIPVVVTNVSGNAEIITDRENGLLAKPRNPNDLAEKMKMVLDDEDLARTIARNGRKDVEKKYGWDIVVEKMDRIYSDLVKSY